MRVSLAASGVLGNGALILGGKQLGWDVHVSVLFQKV